MNLRLWRNPVCVKMIATPIGKFGLVIFFTALLSWLKPSSALPIGITLLIISAWPRRRRVLIAISSLYWIKENLMGWNLIERIAQSEGVVLIPAAKAISVVCALSFCAAALVGVERCSQHPLARHPVRSWIFLYLGLLVVATSHWLNSTASLALWCVLVALGSLFWFLAYGLIERHQTQQRLPFFQRLGAYLPFWGSTHVPYPKGETNLRRIEVLPDQADALATVQLKGFQLLVWVGVLKFVFEFFENWIQNLSPILSTPETLELFNSSAKLSQFSAWISVIHAFLVSIYKISLLGHVLIATARMAGFDALKNTSRPFLSTSVAEFFNRYYFYFKELLVEFFYYPAYLSGPKKYPRLRLVSATIAAAGFGNWLYHYLSDLGSIYDHGIYGSILRTRNYSFYCLVLSSCISISQLLRMRGGPPRKGWPTAFARLRVWISYSLILLLSDVPPDVTPWTSLRFIAGLFFGFH